MIGTKSLQTQSGLITIDKNSIEDVKFSGTTNHKNSEFSETPKVIYFNPNYGVKNHNIHINPNVHTKTSIHLNPKLNSKELMFAYPKESSKASIYVNPKIVKNIDVMQRLQKKESCIGKKAENTVPKTLEGNIKKSVYVNPKLIEKFSSTEPKKGSEVEKKVNNERTNFNVCAKQSVENVVANKLINSKLIPLSRRKLIRVKRSPKGTSGVSIVTPIKRRQNSNAGLRITQVNENTIPPSTRRSIPTNNRLKFVKSKTNASQYNVNGNVVPKRKNRNTGFTKTKGMRNSMKLVSIEGISYKSSKNQLVRRTSTSPVKRKRIIPSQVQDKFFIASNGKTLRRLDTTRKCLAQLRSSNSLTILNKNISIKRTSNIMLRQNVKSHFSNKFKQRSIQILRNKMRKNNQPCLFFQKFGYCANQTKGTCHKIHDKKQVALCWNFLQGKCLLEHCKLSHDVGPEKMPTCKYFLEGCCTRDACPYLHVKVSENTPICRQFLQGYCEKGNECKQRHIHACPEFEKSEKCSKGKQCPYPHKSKTPKISYTLHKCKNLSSSKTPDSTEFTSCITESRKRYYDNSSEDLGKKRERLFKNLTIIKVVQLGQTSETIEDNYVKNVTENSSGTEQDQVLECERPKRPPIGNLPSYIPIN